MGRRSFESIGGQRKRGPNLFIRVEIQFGSSPACLLQEAEVGRGRSEENQGMERNLRREGKFRGRIDQEVLESDYRDRGIWFFNLTLFVFYTRRMRFSLCSFSSQ